MPRADVLPPRMQLWSTVVGFYKKAMVTVEICIDCPSHNTLLLLPRQEQRSSSGTVAALRVPVQPLPPQHLVLSVSPLIGSIDVFMTYCCFVRETDGPRVGLKRSWGTLSLSLTHECTRMQVCAYVRTLHPLSSMASSLFADQGLSLLPGSFGVQLMLIQVPRHRCSAYFCSLELSSTGSAHVSDRLPGHVLRPPPTLPSSPPAATPCPAYPEMEGSVPH